MRLRRTRNFAGTITATFEHSIEIRRDDNGRMESVMIDPEDLESAAPGEYCLRTTGEGIAQPDFLAEWTHYEELPGNGSLRIP